MSRRARILLALAVLALVFRVGFTLRFPRPGPNGGVEDLDQYHSLGVRLVEKGAYLHESGEPAVHREPLYPVVLAALYSVTGPRYWAVVGLNIVLGTLLVLLVWRVGEGLFGERVGLLTAVMSAAHPQLLYYTTEARREILQTLLLLGVLALCLEAARRASSRYAAAAGFTGAILGLANSALLPGAAVLGPALWWFGRRTGRPLLRPALACLMAMGALYAVWPARNFVIFHRFIPGIPHGGDHLYRGFVIPNNAAGTPEADRIIREDPVMQAVEHLPEAERGDAYYRAAVHWIRTHPGGFLARVWESFVKFWRLYPYPRDYGLNYKLIKWVSILSDGWMIPMAFIGMLLAWRRTSETIFLNAILLSVSGVYSIYWAVVRYRLPLTPLYLFYTAFALVSAWDYLRSRSRVH